MIELFAPWIALQEQAIELQRRQIAWAEAAVSSANDMVSAQTAAQAAVEANMKAAESWMSLWGWRRK
ncbi:MAG: hypothetical protein PGN09_09060 [Sphingomonas fennica]